MRRSPIQFSYELQPNRILVAKIVEDAMRLIRETRSPKQVKNVSTKTIATLQFDDIYPDEDNIITLW